MKGNHPKNASGSGKKPLSSALKEKCDLWNLNQREKRLRVSQILIQRKATELAKEVKLGHFNTSNGWLQKFLIPNKFSLRQQTTISQKTPEDIVSVFESYSRYLRGEISKASFITSNMVAMDDLLSG